MVPVCLASHQAPKGHHRKRNYPGQSGGRPDSSILCPESARQDASKSGPPAQAHTLLERMADMPDSATTGQYSAGMNGNWPGDVLTSDQSTSQGSGNPDSDALSEPNGLNMCLRCKFELKTETNVWAELVWEGEMGHHVLLLPPSMELDEHSGCKKKLSYL